MKQVHISASEFKSKCLQLMDESEEKGTEFIITKYGKPISKMVPIKQKPDSTFDAFHSELTITGDVISPIDDGEWAADESNID